MRFGLRERPEVSCGVPRLKTHYRILRHGHSPYLFSPSSPLLSVSFLPTPIRSRSTQELPLGTPGFTFPVLPAPHPFLGWRYNHYLLSSLLELDIPPPWRMCPRVPEKDIMSFLPPMSLDQACVCTRLRYLELFLSPHISSSFA